MGRGGLHVVKGRLLPDRAFFLHDEALAVFGEGGAEGVDDELHGMSGLHRVRSKPLDLNPLHFGTRNPISSS